MFKKLVCTMLAITMTASMLIGCGQADETTKSSESSVVQESSKESESVAEPASSEEEVKEIDKTAKASIRITYAPSELDGANSEAEVVFENFLKEYTNTELIFEDGGASLTAKIAADDAPDIMKVSALSAVPRYANVGVIQPIDEYLANSELYNAEDVFEMATDSFRFDGYNMGEGDCYGLPLDWAPNILFYNTEMLEAAGLTAPTLEDPWTYDEYHEVVDKLTIVKDGEVVQFAQADWVGTIITIERELASMGLSFYSDDYKTINLLDPDVYAVIEKWYNHYASGSTPSNKYPGGGWSEFREGYRDGADYASELSALYRANGTGKAEAVAGKIVAAPLPVSADGYAEYEISPTGGVIAASSAERNNMDIVWACYEFIHLGELADDRAVAGKNLPVKRSSLELAVFAHDLHEQAFNLTVDIVENYTCTYPVNPYNGSGCNSAIGKYFNEAVAGTMTFEDAMKKAQSECQNLINEAIITY